MVYLALDNVLQVALVVLEYLQIPRNEQGL